MSKGPNLSNIAKLELESIDPFQYGLHYSTRYIKHISKVPISDDETYPASDDPETVFRYTFKKTAWSVLEKEKLSAKSTESGIMEFVFNNKMDFALRCNMTRILPKFTVKKGLKNKIQIAWSSDIGHHCYISIKLYIGSTLVQTIHPIWQDVYYKYEMAESKKEVYKKMINTSFSEVWGDHVKEICLKTPLSFSSVPLNSFIGLSLRFFCTPPSYFFLGGAFGD
jgi:hypothetical protein